MKYPSIGEVAFAASAFPAFIYFGGFGLLVAFVIGLVTHEIHQRMRAEFIDGLIRKRKRFALLPVPVWKNTSVALVKSGRYVWLTNVIEMDTLWNGWTAFESDNPAASQEGEHGRS